MTNTIERNEMADRATVTFHTSPETKARLDRLATVTRRSKSYLTNIAVEQYLADEEDFIAHVQAGIADADAGRVFTSAEVKIHLHNLMDRIAANKKSA